ncbi:hypothetical protein [Kushneria aurantia]|uniref:Phytase-like domain-containing protein n=1 Tax=Kushneria aurantia TaxID=504092 RepID=A0ABV6FZP8_9GAMM|nr:hypothetical protein [Kushneria aurantia]
MRARPISHGTLECFPAGLVDDSGEPVHAEVSAVVYDGKRLILGSDKPIPGEGRSSVFSVDIDDEGRPHPETLGYYTQPLIRSAIKYEDFALTADGRHVLATTGFDRISDRDHSLNAYNHLLIWPLGDPDRVQVVDPDPRDNVEGSLELRQRLTAAIGVPYYKIEGLAAIPGERDDGMLLFGVREQGQHFDDFEYVCRVVGAHYRVNDSGALIFTDDLREVYRFDPGEFDAVEHVCGLSSLEYDPYNHRLYLMTSFENESEGLDSIGGYLWLLSLEAFARGEAPALVEDDEGNTLVFEHKSEGLAVLDRDRLFVAYDNDRELALGSVDGDRDEKHACEAPWTLLKMVE